MKPMLKLFVAFCLVSFAFSRPFPEGDDEAAEGEEETKEGETEESDGEDSPDDATEDEDAGSEDAGSDGEDTEEGKGDGEEDKPEGEEEGGDNTEGDDTGHEDSGDDKESSPESSGDKDAAKNDPVNTYNKVVEQLKKDTKVEHENKYLQPALNNALQVGLRNPVVNAISTIGNYSKISSCFKSMGSDVKKILDQEIKSFKDCTSKKDSSEYDCSEENYRKATEQFTQIGSKITSCVSSKGH